jgi:hypothetical protein
MTVLMIERYMLQMMLYNMLCILLYNHSEILYDTPAAGSYITLTYIVVNL